MIILEEGTSILIICWYNYGWVPGNFHKSLSNLITAKQQNASKETADIFTSLPNLVRTHLILNYEFSRIVILRDYRR